MSPKETVRLSSKQRFKSDSKTAGTHAGFVLSLTTA